MALKLKKYPKKPKAKASLQVHQNYLAKVKEIDKHNAEKEKEHKQKLEIRKKISKVGKK